MPDTKQNDLANWVLVSPVRRAQLALRVVEDLSCCCFTREQWDQFLAAERANPLGPEHAEMLDILEQLIPHMSAIYDIRTKSL